MKRTIGTVIPIILIAIFAAAPAYAGVFGSVKGWFTGEIAAIVISAVIAIIGGTAGILYGKIARTFREAGEFLATLGEALEDRRITRDELAAIIRSGKDVFAVWGQGTR